MSIPRAIAGPTGAVLKDRDGVAFKAPHPGALLRETAPMSAPSAFDRAAAAVPADGPGAVVARPDALRERPA